MYKLQKTTLKLADGSSWGSEFGFRTEIAKVPGAEEIAEYVAQSAMGNECSIYLEMNEDATEAYIERVWTPEAWTGFVAIKDQVDIFANLDANGIVIDETVENTEETIEEATLKYLDI
jgi:hypothetical protein